MQHSKYIRRILKLLLFVLIIILLTLIMDAAFEFDEGATEKMLTAYSKQADIDTVFVGNSAGEMLLADQYSGLSGDATFNMCTPSQGFSISLKNIRMASSHHKIDKVILFMTFDTIDSEDEDWIDHLYDRVVDSSSPLSVRITNYLRRSSERSFSKDIINTEESVNAWIPWEIETDHGITSILENLSRRFSRLISGQRLGYEIAYDLNSKKYENAPGTMTDEDAELLQSDLERLSDLSIPEGMLAEDKLELLAQICAYCRNNDIELSVIITPHRSDYYDRYASFRSYSEEVSAYLDGFVSERGFYYYNTENDSRLHKILPDEYFYDWEHVSDEYKEQATSYLYDVIAGVHSETGNESKE